MPFDILPSDVGGDKNAPLMVREVFKKSKWKFKMAFAMKGGGLEGFRVPHTYFEK